MTTSASEVYYFSTGPQIGYCTLHGSYVGYSCPTCSTVVPNYQPTITPAPVSTGEALAATVKVLTDIISSLQEQIAERDRRIKELEDDLNADLNGR